MRTTVAVAIGRIGVVTAVVVAADRAAGAVVGDADLADLDGSQTRVEEPRQCRGSFLFVRAIVEEIGRGFPARLLPAIDCCALRTRP